MNLQEIYEYFAVTLMIFFLMIIIIMKKSLLRYELPEIFFYRTLKYYFLKFKIQYYNIPEVKMKLYKSSNNQKFDFTVKTGVKTFDEVLKGFKNKEITIFTSIPELGNISFVFNMIANSELNKNSKILVFDLPKNRNQIINLYSHIAIKNSIHSSKEFKINNNKSKNTIEMITANHNKKFFYDENCSRNVFNLCKRSNDLSAKINGINLIIIDNFQLLKHYKKIDDRQKEMVLVMQKLKNLAIELEVPIILTHNLIYNENAELDETQLFDDFYKQEAINKIADSVVFMHFTKVGSSLAIDVIDKK